MGAFVYDPVAANNTSVDGIAAAGGSPTGNFDNIVRALAASMRQLVTDLGGATTVAGTADAITIQLNDTGTLSAYFGGMILGFVAASDNTGATTVNVESLGVKKVRKAVDGVETALSAGDIEAGGFYGLAYDTSWDSAAGAFRLIDYNARERNLPVSGTMAEYDTALSDGNFLYESDLGQETIWVPAAAMVPNTTNGPASGIAETTAQDVMVQTLNFDATTAESAQFMIQMPKGWDESTLICQFIWTHGAAVAFGVAWDIAAVAFADGDALDTAFGTAVVATDTGGTTDDVYITAETAAVTVAGSPAAEELVAFRVRRAPANASDTMEVDAKLIGVKIHYTVNALSDS